MSRRYIVTARNVVNRYAVMLEAGQTATLEFDLRPWLDGASITSVRWSTTDGDAAILNEREDNGVIAAELYSPNRGTSQVQAIVSDGQRSPIFWVKVTTRDEYGAHYTSDYGLPV